MLGRCDNCGGEVIRPAECTEAVCECRGNPHKISLHPALILRPSEVLRKLERICPDGVSMERFVNVVLEEGVKAVDRGKIDIQEGKTMSKRRFARIFTRPEKWEKHRTDKGSDCARKIRLEIERLSPFKLRPAGVSVEGGYIPNLNVPSRHLDYDILYDGKRIAVIDPTCSNYTFEDSKIMPVAFYKGQIIKDSDVPAFIIFSMEKEKLPLADRCVWIRGEDVIKCRDDTEPLGGKLQHNYYTNKEDWHRSLQTLVKELLRIVEASKQTMLG